MIRQYRAFEDLDEPCFLVLEPQWITVTYQMKSIICQWRWDDIKELVPKKLTPKAGRRTAVESVNPVSHSQTQIKPPTVAAANNRTQQQKRRNLLRIEFVVRANKSESAAAGSDAGNSSTTERFKWYRFESRDMLDEFLDEAIRYGYVRSLVTYRWFRSSKVRYAPVAAAAAPR